MQTCTCPVHNTRVVFSIACGRIGRASAWTSFTVCKQSQAWVSLKNLLILWISTQSCDNDTSWVDLSAQTAGGRGGKAICSYKDRGGTLIMNTPKETKKGRRNIPLHLSDDCSFPLCLLRCLVSRCVDMDVWICYRWFRHNGLALLLC